MCSLRGGWGGVGFRSIRGVVLACRWDGVSALVCGWAWRVGERILSRVSTVLRASGGDSAVETYPPGYFSCSRVVLLRSRPRSPSLVGASVLALVLTTLELVLAAPFLWSESCSRNTPGIGGTVGISECTVVLTVRSRSFRGVPGTGLAPVAVVLRFGVFTLLLTFSAWFICERVTVTYAAPDPNSFAARSRSSAIAAVAAACRFGTGSQTCVNEDDDVLSRSWSSKDRLRNVLTCASNAWTCDIVLCLGLAWFTFTSTAPLLLTGSE